MTESITITPFPAAALLLLNAMNDANFSLAEGLVSSGYVRQAQQARRARENMVKTLLSQRRMPDAGWDDGTLRLLLHELALMDSNTFVGNAGVGEREGLSLIHI